MNDKSKAYLSLHFCVFIWGFTAILGKLISLQALSLVWWRVFLCSITLAFLVPRVQWRSLNKSLFTKMLSIGFLVSLHWLCFYGAIKWSNASVAVASMATTSFFAAIVEPLMLRQKMKWYELALGILILPGMALVAGNIDFSMQKGLALGILGALLAAIFTTLNKDVVQKQAPPALVMSFTELFGAWVICSMVIPFNKDIVLQPQGFDFGWLLVLAWGCTVLPYYLSLLALRHISAFTANLTTNLEPIYGVLLAGIIFREDKDLGLGFYLGVTIILIAVFSHPFIKGRFEKQA
jgi:drug/metabolite transporter (DMT)-like permease